jgi:hypothetical protein
MNTPKILLILLLSCLGFTHTETSALSDSLQQYARQCDRAIGITVPDFNCDDENLFTRVPTTDHGVPSNAANGLCDRPNQLHQVCDPGSHTWVIRDPNKPDAFAVAHCRKQGLSPGQYGDIAVIQHNTKNGATCFYQALGILDGRAVKAPLKGASSWIQGQPNSPSHWKPAEETAAIACVECHDNGPIIRSPYLAQIEGPNKLPGAGEVFFNGDIDKPRPYFFVGNDFASWKAYRVEVADNICTGCHRMGVSNFGGGGTALDFGIRATAMSQVHKNPHSITSPIWMINIDTNHPTQLEFSPENFAAANKIKDCADRFNEIPLPSSSSCRITLYTGGIGDIDGDGDADRDDLGILLQDRGKSVSQSKCGARCDLDGDGQITGLDGRELIRLCSRSNCATQ